MQIWVCLIVVVPDKVHILTIDILSLRWTMFLWANENQQSTLKYHQFSYRNEDGLLIKIESLLSLMFHVLSLVCIACIN